MDGTPALHPYILPPTPTEILAPINALNERVGQAATSMGLQRQQQQFAERTRQAQDEFLQAQAQRAHQSAAQLMKMHNDMFMQSRAAGFAQKGDVDNQKDNNAAEAQLRAMGFTVPSYPDGATTNQKHTILSDALNKAQNQMVGTLGTLDAKAQAAQQKIRQVMSDPAVAQQVNTAFKGLQAQMEAKNQQVMDNAGGPGTYAKFLQFINNPAMLAKQPGNTTQE